MKGLLSILLFTGSLVLLSGCVKKSCDCEPPAAASKLSYGESVFYLKNTAYTVTPTTTKPGRYTAFPDNLTINPNTGAITITQKGTDGESQTGMWYKVYYRSNSGNEVDSTTILLSGLTYVDQFYNLSKNDSVIRPIYNGDPANAIPAGNYNLTGDNKFAINAKNGEINIRECMRRGFFGNGNLNEAWKIATVKYAINDKSGGVENRIDIVLYYYHTMNDVPVNVSQLMQAHQSMTIGVPNLRAIPTTTAAPDNNLPSSLSLSKPRPPCVIIVAN